MQQIPIQRKKGLWQCILHMSLLLTLITIALPILFYTMGLFSGVFNILLAATSVIALWLGAPNANNVFIGFLWNHTQFDFTVRDSVMEKVATTFFNGGVISAFLIVATLIALIPVSIVVYHYSDLCERYGCCRGVEKDDQ